MKISCLLVVLFGLTLSCGGGSGSGSSGDFGTSGGTCPATSPKGYTVLCGVCSTTDNCVYCPAGYSCSSADACSTGCSSGSSGGGGGGGGSGTGYVCFVQQDSCWNNSVYIPGVNLNNIACGSYCTQLRDYYRNLCGGGSGRSRC